MASLKIPLADRFWKHVDKNGPTVRPELDPCWLWVASRNRNGYGLLMSNGKHVAVAHRVSWVLHKGDPIPDGLFVLHRCDNPPCVNPEHLFLGTNADNMRDMAEKGRSGAGGFNKKVNEAQVKEIRRRHAAGENRTHLGREYGVSKWTITQIVNRRRWSHVS